MRKYRAEKRSQNPTEQMNETKEQSSKDACAERMQRIELILAEIRDYAAQSVPTPITIMETK